MSQSIAEHGLKHEVLDHSEICRRYPGLKYNEEWSAVYDPESGILDADIARSVLQVSCHGDRMRNLNPGLYIRDMKYFIDHWKSKAF